MTDNLAKTWDEAVKGQKSLIINKAVWYIFHGFKGHWIHGRDFAEEVAISFCKKRGVEITLQEAGGIAIDGEDLFETYCE